MAPTIPTHEPESVIATDTWQWDKHLANYPPSEGWSLSYELQGPAILESPLAAATASGGDYFEVRAAPATHPDLVQGLYTLVGKVTKGADVFTVYEGALYVKAFSTAAASTSQDEADLALVNAAITTLLAEPWKVVDIRGRRYEYQDLNDLRELRSELRAAVAQARRGGKFRTHKIHFRHA